MTSIKLLHVLALDANLRKSFRTNEYNATHWSMYWSHSQE